MAKTTRKRAASRKRIPARKKGTKSARTTASRNRTAPRAPRTKVRSVTRGAAACLLRLSPGSPNADAPTGKKVTLLAQDVAGAVLFSRAEYGGKALVAPGKPVSKIEFEVAAGSKTLRMVFVFSGGSAGRGELREDCGAGSSQLIRPIAGDDPSQLMKVVGR